MVVMPTPLSSDALRPETLDEFGGQDDVVAHLRTMLNAARARDSLPDHLLFAGPPGLGKTTLAGIVARELGVTFEETSGPSLERPKDMVGILSSLDGPTVLFVDEIHRLPLQVEEVLYPAMEDGKLDIVVGEGVRARSIRIDVAPFVLIGATTQSGLLSAPLRDRFGYIARMQPYQMDALTTIVQRSATLLDMVIDVDGARVVAGRSRGTPRVANRLLRRVRDWAHATNADTINADIAQDALDHFGVDSAGLDELGRQILTALCVQFAGGPVGVGTLAAAVNETASTVETYESFLMGAGMLVRTARGRMATPGTFTHLGLEVPAAFVAKTIDAPQLPGMNDQS
jgi:Holliday junction DNA helicase RuvB